MPRFHLLHLPMVVLIMVMGLGAINLPDLVLQLEEVLKFLLHWGLFILGKKYTLFTKAGSRPYFRSNDDSPISLSSVKMLTI